MIIRNANDDLATFEFKDMSTSSGMSMLAKILCGYHTIIEIDENNMRFIFGFIFKNSDSINILSGVYNKYKDIK